MSEHHTPPRDPDNGRFISIEDYINRIFEEKQVATNQRFLATEEAVKNAREAAQEALRMAREHIEAIFDEHRRAHTQLHVSTEEAVKQARETIDARLEKLNELRAEVIQDRASYATREMIETTTESIARRLRALEDSNLAAATKDEVTTARRSALAALVGTGVVAVVAIANAVRGIV